MNTLSQLIYFAGVSENLGGLLGFLAFITVFASGVLIIVSFHVKEDIRWADNEDKIRILSESKRYMSLGVASIVLFFVLCISAALMPSKETVYAIAASEMGEELLNTPTAQKASKALDVWLDKQIKENTNVQD